MPKLRIALVFLLLVFGSERALAQCSVNQSTPAFTAGGSVFGRIASQWNQYSAVKVDANNGTACNLTILGTLNLTYAQIVAALGYVPTPTGVITGGTDTSITSAATTDLGGASNPQSDVTVTGNATISSFGTSTPIGQLKVVTFTGTPTLVYNVSNMILPGAANLAVTAKSIGTFKSLGSGNWTMVSYNDASGFPISVVPVAKGGTGLSSGTSGGVLAFTAPGTIASSGALTANMPVIGGGAGAVPTVGTVTGTGTVFALATSPTFVTPALGTIASGNLSAGTVTATGGTTNSALAGRLGDMLDFVKDFSGDPTGVGDACAIIATITTTRPIHVPTGKYLCGSDQTITININLWGDGAAEYNGVGAVPSASGIQGTWFYRTTDVGLTFTPNVPRGYVSGGLRDMAFTEAQPTVTSATGFTGTSGAAVLAVASTAGLSVGMGVSDITNSAYVPPGSTILSLVANTSITISNNLTHNVSNTDTFHFWKPTVYKPWITLYENTGEFDITGLYCYGVYRCINDSALSSNGRMRVDHLRGQSFLHMIELDLAFDSVWIYDSRDWPSWSADAAVTNWTLTNGVPLYMGYANGGPEIVNFFAISKKACLQTYQSTGPFYARIVNFYCDYSKYGIWNTSSNGTSLQISNGLLQGGGYAAGTTAESVGIQDDGGFTAAINAAGSGYSVWDILNISGGTSSQSAQVTVSAVDGSGHVTAIIPSRAGIYTVYPSNPASVTGGSGTSATFNLTWGGANAFYYVDSLICSAQSVACINGTNTTSGSSVSVSNVQVSAFSGIPAVKSVSATGPYYFNIGNFQLAGSSLSAYYDTNNAILGGFTLSDGNLQGTNQRLWHRFSSAGNEAAIFVKNDNAATTSSTCAATGGSTAVANSYVIVRACNNGAATLEYGSAVTSPVIGHAGGTLAIGDVSATSILTPTLTSGGSPAATLAFATSFPNWLFGQSNSGGISQLKVSNTGSGAGTYAEVTAATHGSGNYYMQFYVDEGGTEGVLTTGANLTTGMRLQSASGGIRVDGVNTTTPAGGKNAVCADTGAQPVKIYISSGVTC